MYYIYILKKELNEEKTTVRNSIQEWEYFTRHKLATKIKFMFSDIHEKDVHVHVCEHVS